MGKLKGKKKSKRAKCTFQRYATGEWADEDSEVYECVDADGGNAEVWLQSEGPVRRGERQPVEIIYEGAFEFEGNKKEFKKFFPDLFRGIFGE